MEGSESDREQSTRCRAWPRDLEDMLTARHKRQQEKWQRYEEKPKKAQATNLTSPKGSQEGLGPLARKRRDEDAPEDEPVAKHRRRSGDCG